MIFLAHHRVPPSQLRFSFCLLARSIAPRDDNLESRGKHHRGDDAVIALVVVVVVVVVEVILAAIVVVVVMIVSLV